MDGVAVITSVGERITGVNPRKYGLNFLRTDNSVP